MVQFVVDVVVDTSATEKGAKKVKGKLKEVETSAGRLEKQLKRAFTVAAILGTAVAIGKLADAFTNAQNKLRNIVSGEEELVVVTEKLFDVANRTRQSFESTATVYSRIGVAAKDLGLEQEQLLQFTESLNQAVALSGASATEAEAGLIQLSQGLAAGALRGEELNSVLEQLPAVADVIAKRLDVTRGQLRKMGAEGKISADIVIDAFAEAREELEERFAKTVPTISQAFTVLKNNALEAVGGIDQAIGASAAFSSTLILASENLDIVAAGVLVLALAALPALITAMLAVTGQATIMAAVLSTAALFNPIILGAAAAGAAVILLIDHFIDVEKQARDTKAELDKFLLADDPLLLLTIQNVEKTLGKVQAAAARGLFPDDEAAERIQVLEERLRELRGEQDALNDGSGRTLSMIRAQAIALEELEQAVLDTAKATVEEAQASLLTNRELEKRTALLKEVARIEEEQRKPLSDEQKEALKLAFEQAQALREQQAALEAIRGPQEQLAARIAALNELEQKELITTDELTAALAELAGQAEGVDLSGLGGEGGDASGALAGIQAQIEAAREKARLDGERATILAELAPPLDALIEKERLLIELEKEGEISKATLNEALAKNREEIALLNPEVARLAELTQELINPTNELIQREADLQTLIAQGGPNAAAFAEELKNVQAALNPLTEEEQRRKDILESIEGPETERIARLTELKALLLANTINATQYREELERMGVATETSNTALGGFKVGLANARAEMTDVQGAAQTLTENGFAAAEDALVSFVRTGEADFSAFVDGLLDDIAKLLVKQALLAAFGGGGEAGAGFIGSLFGAAGGGDFPGGAVGIVGEEGPELIRTPPGGASITPAGETAAIMGAQAPTPVVNVGGPTINNMVVDDPEAVPAGIESPAGTQAILNVVRKERRTIRGTIG